MTLFKHIIITRFNIPMENINIASPKWLKHRFHLFENYCLPSIKNQTNKNFVWFVYFDKNTPEFFKKKIKIIQNSYPVFIPFFVSNYDLFTKNLPKDIFSQLNKEPYVITTRLDNDDVLHKNAVNTIQEYFVKKNNIALNLQKGFCFDVNKQILSKYSYPKGPFLSLIETTSDIENFRSVYFQEHTAFFDTMKTIQITNNYFWIQIIHDENVSNKLRGSAVIKNKSFFHMFGINTKISFKNLFFYSFRFLLQKIKEQIKFFISPIKKK